MAFQTYSRKQQAQPLKQKQALLSTQPRQKKTSVKPLERPMKDDLKPTKTISTAAILKRKPMKEVYVPKYRARRREPDHPLFLDYKDELEAYRATLECNSRASLGEAYEDICNSVKAIKVRNDDTLTTAKAQMETVLAPLAEDKITKKIVSNSGAKEMTETLQVGEQIEAFRKLLATEEAELKLRWKRWDKIQQELVELGVEVLGENATGSEKVGKLVKGYAAEKAVWDAEFKQQLQGPEEELEAAGKVAIEKLAAAEKEIDARFNSQKAQLISMITQDD